MEMYLYFTENKTLLLSARVFGKNFNLYGEKFSVALNLFYLT